jgi:hypothetical protein
MKPIIFSVFLKVISSLALMAAYIGYNKYQDLRYISGTRELSGVIEKTRIKRRAVLMRKRQKEIRFNVWWD